MESLNRQVLAARPDGTASDAAAEADTKGPRPAVVLSCLGAPEGDLSLVRSLGEQGVPVILLSEYADPPAAASRHCRAFVHLPAFTQQPQRLLQALRQVRAALGRAPVLFASADPDLVALCAIRAALGDTARVALPPDALVRRLTDKAQFDVLAVEADLPVPRSLPLGEPDSGRLRPDWRQRAAQLAYPLVAKPASPEAWQGAAVPEAFHRLKAQRLDQAADLERLCAQLPAPAWAATLLQEYVPGGDEEHFGVHACLDADGRVLATSVTRNWRVYPAYAGGGCCMESVDEPALEALGLAVLAKVGFRGGIANMDFKRHARSGAFKLLEINPRISQAHILSTRAGVNLPWLAWRDACGLPPLPAPARRIGLRYINEFDDLLAMRTYRRDGLWPWSRWLAQQLGGPVVYQLCQWRDPRPAWTELAKWLPGHPGRRRQAAWRRAADGVQAAQAAQADLPVLDARQLDALRALAGGGT